MTHEIIGYDDWQNMTYAKAEKIFFDQPLFWPPPRLSSHGIYAFFDIKGYREYLRYIGRGYLYNRLRAPWYHQRSYVSDAVRVLPIPIWETPRIQNWAQYEGWIDAFEIHMILKYNPPRNRHWRSNRPPHDYTTVGRPLGRLIIDPSVRPGLLKRHVPWAERLLWKGKGACGGSN